MLMPSMMECLMNNNNLPTQPHMIGQTLNIQNVNNAASINANPALSIHLSGLQNVNAAAVAAAAASGHLAPVAFGFPEIGEGLSLEGLGWDEQYDWGEDAKDSWEDLSSSTQWEESKFRNGPHPENVKFRNQLAQHPTTFQTLQSMQQQQQALQESPSIQPHMMSITNDNFINLDAVDSYISNGSGSSSDEDDEFTNSTINVNNLNISNPMVDNSNVVNITNDLNKYAWEDACGDNIDFHHVDTNKLINEINNELNQMNTQSQTESQDSSSNDSIDDTTKESMSRVILTRDTLERWIHDPLFNRLIRGFYVRVGVQENSSSGAPVIININNCGDNTLNHHSYATKIGKIVEGRDYSFEPYRIHNDNSASTTTKGIILQFCNNTIQVPVPLSSVLNEQLSEAEMEQYAKEISSNPVINTPTSEISEKLKIADVLNSKYPSTVRPVHIHQHQQQQQQPYSVQSH